MDTTISEVSVLFLLVTTVSTRMLLYKERSNYIYYEFTFTQRKMMVHNFPLSTQIGLFPEQLKKEV